MFWNVSDIKTETMEFYRFLDADYKEGASTNQIYSVRDNDCIGYITNKMRMNMEIKKSVDVLFNEVAQFNALTAEEDFTLTKAVQDKGTDCDEMKKLHEVYDRFVEGIAKQYLDKGLSLDELVEVGKTGLEKAAMKYDSTRGFKFIAYAVWWIRQPMLVAIESKE